MKTTPTPTLIPTLILAMMVVHARHRIAAIDMIVATTTTITTIIHMNRMVEMLPKGILGVEMTKVASLSYKRRSRMRMRSNRHRRREKVVLDVSGCDLSSLLSE